MINYGVSAGVGMACLITAALLWTIGNRMLPRVTTILVMTGVAGLTSTWAGEQARGAVGTATRLIDGVTVDVFDAKISGFVALALAFIVGVQLYRKQVEWLTLAAAALLPLAARSASGDLGNGIAHTIAGVVRFVAGLVAPLTGTR